MLLGVDVGGTFTDAVLVGDGWIRRAKAPTTPRDESRGVLAAIEGVLGDASAGAVQRFAHGMTVATNALLEGRGARTALLATEGFTDVVELGRQARAELYRLCASRPQPLVEPPLRLGVPERAGPEGVLRALTPAQAAALAERVATIDPPVSAVAVVLLHSYAHPQHERLLGEALAARLPDVHVSLSHQLVGTFREYERAASTELDAALSPLLAGYLTQLAQATHAAGLPAPAIMQSAGGLTSCEHAADHAALTVLSGPAGGVGGARLLAAAAGERDVLCFDMGGTSCDVCAITGGAVGETSERTIAGRPLALPALDIETVGAGGGSIAWRDPGGALRVGPHSAGARPGPACYGRGGVEATVTDANVVLGRLPADARLSGGIVLDGDAARAAVTRLAATVALDVEACAEGIVRVAQAQMAGALRRMTVERGIDPRDFVLMPFGGAGGLHAAALADELGIVRVLFARDAGVLSALGLAAAAPRRDAARTVMLSGGQLTGEATAAARGELVARTSAALHPDDAVRVRVRYELRYRGQSFELGIDEELTDTAAVDVGALRTTFERAHAEPVDVDALRAAFERVHEERYGYRDEGEKVELVTIRVSAWGRTPTVNLMAPSGLQPERETRRAIVDGEELTVQCLRGEPPPGTEVEGPSICALPEATLWVPPGWAGEVDAQGSVRLRRAGSAGLQRA